jgi:hypothetical protein
MVSEQHSLWPSAGRRVWQVNVAPKFLAVLFSVGILQYWSIFLLGFIGVYDHMPYALGFGIYFVHWSSVGGLIGWLVSKNRVRGGLFGALLGLLLSGAQIPAM